MTFRKPYFTHNRCLFTLRDFNKKNKIEKIVSKVIKFVIKIKYIVNNKYYIYYILLQNRFAIILLSFASKYLYNYIFKND